MLVALKLFVAHFLADFVFQGSDMARKKGRQARHLLLHSGIVFLATYALLAPGNPPLSAKGAQIFALSFALAALHGLIDYFTSRRWPRGWEGFLLDQGLHWACILGAVGVCNSLRWDQFLKTLEAAVSNEKSLIVALGYLVSLFFGSVLVERICLGFEEIYAGGPSAPEGGPKAGEIAEEDVIGRFIGIIERLLVTTFVLYGQYGAVGYVFAAKSLGRFAEGDMKSLGRRFPAYYLVGTLTSFAIAVGCGLAMAYLLSRAG